MRIVEEPAILDNVMNGRLELGLVCGTYAEYFRIQHVEWEQRRDMTNEGCYSSRKHSPGVPSALAAFTTFAASTAARASSAMFTWDT